MGSVARLGRRRALSASEENRKEKNVFRHETSHVANDFERLFFSLCDSVSPTHPQRGWVGESLARVGGLG